MKAEGKVEFIECWEDYVNQFTRLGQSTDKPDTWEEIKSLKEDMRKLIHKVADEVY